MRREVRRVRIPDRRGRLQQLGEIGRKHGPDGVERVVPTEALALQSLHDRDDFRHGLSELVLEAGVHDGMQKCVRERDPCARAILLDEKQALVLVEGKQFTSRRGNLWCVGIHDADLVQLTFGCAAAAFIKGPAERVRSRSLLVSRQGIRAQPIDGEEQFTILARRD